MTELKKTRTVSLLYIFLGKLYVPNICGLMVNTTEFYHGDAQFVSRESRVYIKFSILIL